MATTTASKLKVTTPDDTSIVVTRVLNAPRHLVYECWTTPALVRRWLLGPPGWEMTTCEMDVRVGGKFRWAWKDTSGARMIMFGTYREIVPNTRILQTEAFEEPAIPGEALSGIDLVEHAGKTTLTTTVRYANREARDAALQSGMADGMEAGFVRADALFAELQGGGQGARA